jgi:16S rRNA (guanine527-N7)-methyltransferase
VSETVLRYFPDLSAIQKEKLLALRDIYTTWNGRINVISRRDMDNFMVHHLLHSLSIAKIISFTPGTAIMDVGTGGGFPGIPLAILFPESEFTLLDSIEKKIRVVTAVAEELRLENVIPVRKRVEEEKNKFHFVISRAVTDFRAFARLTLKNIAGESFNTLGNGIIYLKGGGIEPEAAAFGRRLAVWEISDFFAEPFFETKKILYLIP